ncbi:MAG: PVC-type heme-binding CxxCH protein [Acidobacteriota bacterium]
MRRVLAITVVLVGVTAVVLIVLWRVRGRQPYASTLDSLTVLEGFAVETAALPPLVERPMVADFDEQGRLYVADSSGSNEKVKDQLEKRPHRIVRLEDVDNDGRFDRSTIFADKMMLPEGALWHEGSLYVAAPPSIWKLTDTNNDGVADQREEWFQGKTLTNCANDLHGPYLGLDGWIYWCKGAFAEQTYERRGKPPLITRAAHIFRRSPDGSVIEPVMTGGMDNPIEVVFSPEGERFFTSTFLLHPEAGRRDGLVHAIYGGVYGKIHSVLDAHPKTGDVMPVMTHLGPAVPCGLACYASEGFGPEYRNNLFACLFNLHKVTRHVLQPSGATFITTDSDFLVSSNPDFHPTDVLEDADGSLLVLDTGAWYKICCPTSQLAKPDLLGGIYRVRRKGMPLIQDARGLGLPWDLLRPSELVELLGDPRPVVCRRAMGTLARFQSNSVPALRAILAADAQNPRIRRNAVWTLTRIEGEEARSCVRGVLQDRDSSVRQAALHSAGLWRDRAALPQLLTVLKNDAAPLQRVAAEGLGRIGERRAVPFLLEATAHLRDRILEHALTYALIEIGDPAGTAAGLTAASPNTRRAALIALDQMPGGKLRPEQVAPLLTSRDDLLKQTASWIAGHHPEWGATLSGFFAKRLAKLASEDRPELEKQLAFFSRDPAIQTLLAQAVKGIRGRPSRLVALRAMSGSPLKDMPAVWATPLARVLEEKDAETVRLAVSVAKALPIAKGILPGLAAALLRVAGDSSLDRAIRLDALLAMPQGPDSLDSDLFNLLRSGLNTSQPLAIRSAASEVLSRANLSPDQLKLLALSLREVGPMEIAKVLEAFGHSSDETLGRQLIGVLKESKGISGLRPDVLKRVVSRFPGPVQDEAEKLLAFLEIDQKEQSKHLHRLLGSLRYGDIRRGQIVFNSTKAACSSCHTIGYLGGRLGPDLTRIGEVRSEHDLLESIIYPSASFVRSYEPLTVVTRSGEVHNGIVRDEGTDEIFMATGARAEVRIARTDIAQMRPGTVSLMPAGLEEQLTRTELADLLAFLKAARKEAR